MLTIWPHDRAGLIRPSVERHGENVISFLCALAEPKAHLKLRRFKSLWLGRKQQERNDVGLKKRPLRLARQLRLLFGGGERVGCFYISMCLLWERCHRHCTVD